MRWYNFFHIYQPPSWDADIIRRVANEAYRPLLRILRNHPDVRITLNISGSLTEQLLALQLHDVISGIQEGIEQRQIELVGSAMYHPIVPSIPRSERLRQFDLQAQLHRRVFGVDRLHGCYLPEMAFDPSVEEDILGMGYSWVLLDEICAGRGVGAIKLDQPYITPRGLTVVFRNRPVSDWMSFQADPHQPALALEAIMKDVRSSTTLVTALDGENLGHHRHGADLLWERLVTSPTIETGTLSEFAQQPSSPLQPLAGSWSSLPSEITSHIPFGLWNNPNNPIHAAQWRLTNTILSAVRDSEHDPFFPAARRLLDAALASDRYWWASAQPWWDATIILRETQRLADVIGPLSSLSPETRSTVAEQIKTVSTLVRQWESDGTARRHQATYLHHTGDVRYMAGQQLYV